MDNDKLINNILEYAYDSYLKNKEASRGFRLIDAISYLNLKLDDLQFRALFYKLIDTQFVKSMVSSDSEKFNIENMNALYFTNIGLYRLEKYINYLNFLSEVSERKNDKKWSRASVLIAVGALIVSFLQFIIQEPEINDLQDNLKEIQSTQTRMLLQELQSKKESYQIDTLNSNSRKSAK